MNHDDVKWLKGDAITGNEYLFGRKFAHVSCSARDERGMRADTWVMPFAWHILDLMAFLDEIEIIVWVVLKRSALSLEPNILVIYCLSTHFLTRHNGIETYRACMSSMIHDLRVKRGKKEQIALNDISTHHTSLSSSRRSRLEEVNGIIEGEIVDERKKKTSLRWTAVKAEDTFYVGRIFYETLECDLRQAGSSWKCSSKK